MVNMIMGDSLYKNETNNANSIVFLFVKNHKPKFKEEFS